MLIYIKTSLKLVDVQTLFQSFISSFSFCFALMSEVFLGVDICLSGNNFEIALEINFIFIGCLSKKACFVNPVLYQNICLQSDRNKQEHLMVNCLYIY